MTYETIKYEKEDGFCVITMNRPERLNALNPQMWQDLEDAFDEAMTDDEIKALIYTGAPRTDGRPCFSAGADLKELAGPVKKEPKTTDVKWSPVTAFWTQRQPKSAAMPVFERIAWSPKITIAAVDGVCTAGGLELALSCDIILVSETAQISDMHVKNLGWIGGGGGPANLAWRVGVSKAIELCCIGNVIDGKEAYRIGLANQLFTPDKLLDGAREMARTIGGMRLAALTMTKATCRAVWDMDYQSAWHYSDAGLAALVEEKDNDDWGPERWVKEK